VVAGAEEHVAAALDDRAVLERREVDEARRELRVDLAVYAQARDAAVGDDLELDVGEPTICFDLKLVLGVARQLAARDLDPVRAIDPAQVERVVDLGGEHAARLGEVAAEERGVDDDATNAPGHAESHDAPVVIAVGRRVADELGRATAAG